MTRMLMMTPQLYPTVPSGNGNPKQMPTGCRWARTNKLKHNSGRTEMLFGKSNSALESELVLDAIALLLSIWGVLDVQLVVVAYNPLLQLYLVHQL